MGQYAVELVAGDVLCGHVWDGVAGGRRRQGSSWAPASKVVARVVVKVLDRVQRAR